MSHTNRLMVGATGALLLTTALATSLPASAGSSAGAFIGGMLTTKILGNMRQRTEADQQQAYYAQQSSQQQQVRQAAPAASSTKSTEQKLDELDKLAAGGYITPAEYKTKKQAIINAL
jgi:hypothetical protein